MEDAGELDSCGSFFSTSSMFLDDRDPDSFSSGAMTDDGGEDGGRENKRAGLG